MASKHVWMQLVLAIIFTADIAFSLTTSSDFVTTSEKEHSDAKLCRRELIKHNGPSNVKPMIEKSHLALLLLLGFGGFSMLIALLYRALRTYVFKDVHNLDTVFDAGGQVSLSLTAVTVTSQLLWPSDFVMSPTLNSKSGLGGSLFCTLAIVVNILLLPPLLLYLKTRAPGAKTFPQISYARFGKPAHIVFCVLALLTNLIVSTSVMLAAKSIIQTLGKDMNNEFVFIIIAVLFGSYCFIGGLGTTFYISYFNTALTFLAVTVYVLNTSFYPASDIEDVTKLDEMYDEISCLQGPVGNYDNSYLTFRSKSGIIYGVVYMFMATSSTFCDQATWQSRIAAKPTQGVLGFLMSAYMWCVIPMTLSFTTSLSYFALSARNGTNLLSDNEIDDGYITPFVLATLLGDTGSYLLLTMMTMALMSTGSGEVMAISSIIVYDIYKTHIKPFRRGLSVTACMLCGKKKFVLTTDGDDLKADFCACASVTECEPCKTDILGISASECVYSCPHHGKLRHYEDGLMRYKNWCMLCVVIAIVPYGLLVAESGINVTWATLAIPTVTSPFLLPLFLTIAWSKATGAGMMAAPEELSNLGRLYLQMTAQVVTESGINVTRITLAVPTVTSPFLLPLFLTIARSKATGAGMIAGGVIGLIASLSAMLITASTYDEGLNNFFVNTGQDYSLLYAMVAGIVVSGVLCFVVSMCTHNIRTMQDAENEWAKTFSIDNPLNPFRLVYKEELDKIGATQGVVITSATMDRLFIRAKRIAYIGTGISLVLFVIVVPSVALSYTVLSLGELKTWMRILQYWCFVVTLLVVIVPPVEEGIQIYKKYREIKTKEQQMMHQHDKAKRQEVVERL